MQHRDHVVRLSALQYNMLKVFVSEGEKYRMSIEQAGQFDQRPFASMLKRQYVEYDQVRRGFRLTSDGRTAMANFETANILRHVASMQLTSFFIMPKQFKTHIGGKWKQKIA